MEIQLVCDVLARLTLDTAWLIAAFNGAAHAVAEPAGVNARLSPL